MKRFSFFMVPVLMGSLLILGCKSHHGFESYVSPQVKGRVLNAATHEPIGHVKILLNPRNDQSYAEVYVSAGERQELMQSNYSNEEGDFVVASHKDLSFSGENAWTSVTLKFLHEGYHMFTTNYPYSRAVATQDGKPVVDAGDILLQPLPAR